jgi:hypothetical protein
MGYLLDSAYVQGQVRGIVLPDVSKMIINFRIIRPFL